MSNFLKAAAQTGSAPAGPKRGTSHCARIDKANTIVSGLLCGLPILKLFRKNLFNAIRRRVRVMVGQMAGLSAVEKVTMWVPWKVLLWVGQSVETMSKKLVTLIAGLTGSEGAGQWGRKWVAMCAKTKVDKEDEVSIFSVGSFGKLLRETIDIVDKSMSHVNGLEMREKNRLELQSEQ